MRGCCVTGTWLAAPSCGLRHRLEFTRQCAQVTGQLLEFRVCELLGNTAHDAVGMAPSRERSLGFAGLWRRRPTGLLGSKAIKWNFTKFLVGKDGNVLKRYAPTETPASMTRDIEAALAA